METTKTVVHSQRISSRYSLPCRGKGRQESSQIAGEMGGRGVGLVERCPQPRLLSSQMSGPRPPELDGSVDPVATSKRGGSGQDLDERGHPPSTTSGPCARDRTDLGRFPSKGCHPGWTDLDDRSFLSSSEGIETWVQGERGRTSETSKPSSGPLQ